MKKLFIPLWLIIAIVLAFIGLILYMFKDKIFQKKSDKNIKFDDTGMTDIQKTVHEELGTQEFAGSASNPEVEEYFKELGYSTLKDDTPWCGAFVGYVLKSNGYKISSTPLRARSFENVEGENINFYQNPNNSRGNDINAIPYHSVVVAWRTSKSSGNGHIAFFVEKVGDKIRLAGGNQSNEVNDTYLMPITRVTRIFNPVKA